jgi:hypothetical protein
VGRDQGNEGDLFPFHDLQDLLGAEGSGRMNVHRGADVSKGEGEEGGVDVAQGHHVHAHVLLVEPEVHGIDQEKGDVGFMGANHSFGFSGGSGGINQNPGVPGGHRYVRFIFRCPVNHRFVFPVTVPGLIHHDIVLRWDLLQLILDGVHAGGKFVVYGHGFGIGIVDDVGHLPSHQAKIDRDNDNAGLGRRQVELDNFDAVFHEDGQLVALFQAHFHQAVGQTVDPAVYFGVGEPSPGVA